MTETFDHIIVGGGSSGCVAAARLVNEARARVLLLEAGHSHRHPLLDMPPGIFKMINGSKFMRYHKTVPQEHLNGRCTIFRKATCWAAARRSTRRSICAAGPPTIDEWHESLRGENDYPGWAWARCAAALSRHGGKQPAVRRASRRGRVRCSSPTPAISTISRAGSCRACRRSACRYNHDFNGPQQRGVGFYQFMNRRGKRSSAAYAFLAPLERQSQSDHSPALQGEPHRNRERPRRGRNLARRRWRAAPRRRPTARSSSPPARW